MQKTEVLELGYFIEGTDRGDPAGFELLVHTMQEGEILPCLWAWDTDEALTQARVPFVEIPVEGDVNMWPMGCYGLGFSQAFLQRQGAVCADEGGALPAPQWHSASPIRFACEDIQTVYVATPDEVSEFRMLYPRYEGTFVVLC